MAESGPPDHLDLQDAQQGEPGAAGAEPLEVAGPPRGTTPPHPAGHEPDVVNVRLVVAVSIATLAFVGFALTAMVLTFNYLAEGDLGLDPGLPDFVEQPAAVAPPVAIDQPEQLRELRTSEQQRLNEYRWIDRSQGIARIPIERAMQLRAEQALNAVDSNAAPAEDPRGAPARPPADHPIDRPAAETSPSPAAEPASGPAFPPGGSDEDR